MSTPTLAPASESVLLVGFRKGVSTFWTLMKIMVPVYVVVSVLGHTPVLPAVSRFFEPFMGIWHLPGEAALALLLGHVVGLYAALAVIAVGGWDPVSVTVAGVILGISHSLVMEGAIFRKMRAPAMLVVSLRIITGWTLGWVVATILT